ncbi:MAG: PIG-L family deacetylase [Anaerolineales bacterium]|nr:PIG-L family deacetylase [Anaerolineales bacterium]
MPGRKRLLAVFAHPDDESFGAGGTLALYAARGAQVHLICATRGELGEAPPDRQGFATVAEMRESELHCAGRILGLAGIHFLGYRDSGMPGAADNRHPRALAAAPRSEVARNTAGLIRQLRPQVIVTFDPVGGYFHPDHIAAHRAAVDAFSLASDPAAFPGDGPPYSPQKLYFHLLPLRLIRWAERLLRWVGRDPSRFGRKGDIDLTALAKVSFPVHARIDIRPALAAKREAAACHVSQGGGAAAGLPLGLARVFGASEAFMRGRPQPPPSRIERDLFAGVDEER